MDRVAAEAAFSEMLVAGFWAHLDIEFGEMEPGQATLRIRLRDHHLNYNNVAHGGVLSGLVDSAAGAAIRTLRSVEEIAARPHATSDLHVQYLAGAKANSTLVATARVVKLGRTAIFCEVGVEDDAGRLVGRGSVTFVIGPPREP